ncbi:hypothetical protein HanIR_Chr07g0341471 [Helianthus annuus]|nr:hypothetical protein HanIR_Chr07g0341471 [Helianthus annuus]
MAGETSTISFAGTVGPGATLPELLISLIPLLLLSPSVWHRLGKYTPFPTARLKYRSTMLGQPV